MKGFCCFCGIPADGGSAVIHGGTEYFGGEFPLCPDCEMPHCDACDCSGEPLKKGGKTKYRDVDLRGED